MPKHDSLDVIPRPPKTFLLGNIPALGVNGAYVCGDASHMAPDVRRAFAAVHAAKAGAGAAAGRWLDEMAARNRHLVHVWAAS